MCMFVSMLALQCLSYGKISEDRFVSRERRVKFPCYEVQKVYGQVNLRCLVVCYVQYLELRQSTCIEYSVF